MSTRRDVIRTLPAAGAAFAVAGNLILDESPARAQAAAPLKGHFHPQGKAPSNAHDGHLASGADDLAFRGHARLR